MCIESWLRRRLYVLYCLYHVHADSCIHKFQFQCVYVLERAQSKENIWEIDERKFRRNDGRNVVCAKEIFNARVVQTVRKRPTHHYVCRMDPSKRHVSFDINYRLISNLRSSKNIKLFFSPLSFIAPGIQMFHDIRCIIKCTLHVLLRTQWINCPFHDHDPQGAGRIHKYLYFFLFYEINQNKKLQDDSACAKRSCFCLDEYFLNIFLRYLVTTISQAFSVAILPPSVFEGHKRTETRDIAENFMKEIFRGENIYPIKTPNRCLYPQRSVIYRYTKRK